MGSKAVRIIWYNDVFQFFFWHYPTVVAARPFPLSTYTTVIVGTRHDTQQSKRRARNGNKINTSTKRIMHELCYCCSCTRDINARFSCATRKRNNKKMKKSKEVAKISRTWTQKLNHRRQQALERGSKRTGKHQDNPLIFLAVPHS